MVRIIIVHNAKVVVVYGRARKLGLSISSRIMADSFPAKCIEYRRDRVLNIFLDPTLN